MNMRPAILLLMLFLIPVLCAEEPKPALKSGSESKVTYRRLFGNEYSKAAAAYKLNEKEFTVLKPEHVRDFHAQNEINFVQMQEDFGYARMGRLPSSYAYFVKPAGAKSSDHVFKDMDLGGDMYILKRRELIGLAMQAKPVVYESPNIIDAMGSPSMRMPANTKTREPDPAETAALEAMQKGGDITVREESNAIRIVGSLRARKECLACHDCKEGDLLGALSYRLELARDGEAEKFQTEHFMRTKDYRKANAEARAEIEKNADTRYIRTLKAHNIDVHFKESK